MIAWTRDCRVLEGPAKLSKLRSVRPRADRLWTELSFAASVGADAEALLVLYVCAIARLNAPLRSYSVKTGYFLG